METVETSDSEERELVAAQNASYWSSQNLPRTASSSTRLGPRTAIPRERATGDDAWEESSRKRRKLDHSPLHPTSKPDASPSRALPLDGLSRGRSASSSQRSTSFVYTPLAASPSPGVELAAPSPPVEGVGSYEDDDESGMAHAADKDDVEYGISQGDDIWGISQDQYLDGVPDDVAGEDIGDISQQLWSPSPPPLHQHATPSRRQLSLPNGSLPQRAYSEDPLLLTPRKAAAFGDARYPTPSFARGSPQRDSSPLTPTSSQRAHSAPSSPVAGPSRGVSSADAENERLTEELLAQEETTETRYSFRVRAANQLKPYEYDKMLYKRQMRANPEAIVKVRSPRRRSRSRSRSKGRRSRSRSRARDNGDEMELGEDSQDKEWREGETQERNIDVEMDDGLDEYMREVERKRRRNERAREREKAKGHTSAGKQGGGGSATGWLPEALRQTFSSDEDEAPAPENKGRGRAQKRRLERFPMRLPKPKPSPPPSVRSPSASPVMKKSQRRVLPPSSPLGPENDEEGEGGDFHFGDDGRDDQFAPAYDFDFDSGTENPAPPTSTSPGRTSPSAPASGDDASSSASERGDGEESASEDGESSGSDEAAPLAFFDSRSGHALRRMMPMKMINDLFGLAKAKPKPKAKVHEEDDGPLQPGRARVTGNRANLGRAIVVDSESESDGDEDGDERRSVSPPGHVYPASLSASDGETNGARRQHARRPSVKREWSPEVIDISEDMEQEDSASDSDAVQVQDDALIEPWLNLDRPRGGNLIDYMLSRTETAARTRKKKSKGVRQSGLGGARHGGDGRGGGGGSKHGGGGSGRHGGGGSGRHGGTARSAGGGGSGHASSSRRPYRYDMAVGGARRSAATRQTHLSFQPGHAPRYLQRTDSLRSALSNHRSRSRSADPNVHYVTVPEEGNLRKKKKPKQARLHINRSEGHMLVGLRRRIHAVTVDLEDEAFHRALAPVQQEQVRAAFRRTTSKAASERDDRAWGDDIGNPFVGLEDDERESRKTITVDFGVQVFPPGIAFGPSTYIGRGWLHELITVLGGTENMAIPAADDIELTAASSPAELSAVVSRFCGQLSDLVESKEEDDDETSKLARTGHTLCEFISYVLHASHPTDAAAATIAIARDARSLTEQIDERLRRSFKGTDSAFERYFLAYWFAIEVVARLQSTVLVSCEEGADPLPLLIKSLSKRLQEYGFQRTMEGVVALSDNLDGYGTPQRVAELWICLLHLSAHCAVRLQPSRTTHGHPLLNLLQQPESSPSWSNHLEASESTWRAIFSLSALSQFSTHGMSRSDPQLVATWDLVLLALKQIRLTSDVADEKRVHTVNRKRDDYIRLVTSRCFALCTTWRWDLENVVPVLHHLQDVFKTRKYCNLRGEASDYPSFMREHDLSKLSETEVGDTAFSIFLKIIVRAAECIRAPGTQGPTPPKLKKMLSLIAPAGSVPFNKSVLPRKRELSMLFNRLCTVVIGIYLDPSEATITRRLGLVREYVDFSNADYDSRKACIRAVMHLVILFRHLQLDLSRPLAWLKEMTTILIAEYAVARNAPRIYPPPATVPEKDRLSVLIQLILGCVRTAIETPSMEPTSSVVRYPDPVLLDGPWVTEVLRVDTHLTDIDTPTNGLQIRQLLQAFLDARRSALPKPTNATIVGGATTEESQESQDDYGAFEIDMDDPELLVALGEAPRTTIPTVDYAKHEEATCKVINDALTREMYRLVIQNVLYQAPTETMKDYCCDADKWIDCWIGCANVLVQNRKRDWSFYFKMTSGGWEGIPDASRRRRVSLRFTHMVLQLDRTTYTTLQNDFLRPLAEAFVSAHVTLEHEYVSLVFSADGLRHTLFLGINCVRSSDSGDYVLSKAEFLECRLTMLNTIFANADANIQRRDTNQHQRVSIDFVVAALSAMESIRASLDAGEKREVYDGFCRALLSSALRLPALSIHPELQFARDFRRLLSS